MSKLIDAARRDVRAFIADRSAEHSRTASCGVVTADYYKESARLWRVALAAVRADIKKRGTQWGRR